MISVHPESTHHLSRSLKLIRSNGCEAGDCIEPWDTNFVLGLDNGRN